MLADSFKTTAIGLIAFVFTVLIRRLVDSFTIPSAILNVINIVTVFVVCFIIVVIAKAWVPRRS